MPEDLSGAYRAKHHVVDGPKRHRPGSIVHLSHKDAARLLASGSIEPMCAEALEPETPSTEEPSSPLPEAESSDTLVAVDTPDREPDAVVAETPALSNRAARRAARRAAAAGSEPPTGT